MRELVKAEISKVEALCATALAVAFVAMMPLSALAVDGKEVVAGGGEISFTGASETKWVTNADGSQDLLLIFSAPETPGSFTFPGVTQARILTVGGGGGGGGSFKNATAGGNYGGGGGGGGGAVVETNNLFVAGTYDVTVGAGGVGGIISAKRPTAQDFSGEDGGETSIMVGEDVFMSAVGGGGGGAECAGHSGANGGGGSKLWNSSGGVNNAGGAGTVGYAGGAGDLGNYGGGGGGAGGAGTAAATKDPKGGAGVSSDITGVVAWYAGGGGGGNNNKSAAAGTKGAVGGSGVGGVGGVGSGIVAPGAGQPGTGSGGGGASYNVAGGAGGSGAVYVRISGAIAGGLSKPKDLVIPYDGKPHTSYESSPFYTVEGTSTATEIGVYPVTVTPKPGIKWDDDGSDAAVTVTMTIYDPTAKSGTEIVTDAPIDYFGAAEVTRIGNDLLLKFTGAGSFTLPGTAVARILAVGGGGGGGGSFKNATANGNYGGGGGGGAGAVVQKDGTLSAGIYKIGVGVGGAGGVISAKRPTALDFSGGDGGDTVILMGSEDWVMAPGGGGGGAECAGHPGASGGGGSKLWNSSGGVNNAGGAGTSGLGFAGGAGDFGNYGGGGGGAAGPGVAASSKKPDGGPGVSSDITGETAWYAGGGGGGNNNKSATAGTAGAAGGSGVGGNGGVGSGIVAPSAGQPCTGSGGGGASYNAAGGAGGSGVVYVRISAAMVGELKKPEKVQVYTYDGNAHTSVVESAFYELNGENVGTDSGVYEVAVMLKAGFTWPGGDTESPVNVKMTIEKQTVTFADLAMASWSYTARSAERPEPTCTVTPAWVVPVFEYAAATAPTPEAIPEENWGKKPSDVGSYYVRARIADTKNYEGETVYAKFEITKAKVTFADLVQKDWMEGTPDEAIPRPRYTVTPSWVEPIFQYAAKVDSPEEEWSDEKPTEIGEWAIRILAPNTTNYDFTPLAAPFKIVKGRGGTFVDYVEITIDGYKGTNPSVLTNFPTKIMLSEDGLAGFLYSRAGDDGEELGITDEKGNDLMYRVDDWQIHGESAIWVRVPEIGPDKQVIRLYWMLREGATAPDHRPEIVFDTWSKKQVESMTAPKQTFDLVVKNGYRVNYWTTFPKMTKAIWAEGQAAGRLIAGRLAEGSYSQTIVNTVTGEVLPSMPTKGGAYRYILTLDDPNLEYEPLEFHVDFAITTSTSMDDLKGDAPNLTVNGRVMLANDDSAPGHEIEGQSYWHDDPEKGSIWWEHSGTHTIANTMPNLYKFAGCNHRLSYLDEAGNTNLLWRMEDVLLGNTFRNATMEGTRCFLPWSPTGLGISSEKVAPGTRDESGWMVFRNTTNAKIYSPCYTNGIGTIYFDAVNAFAIRSGYNPDDYSIAVEIVTNVVDETGRTLPPTDENCRGLNEYGNEDEFGRLHEELWTPVKMIALKRDNNASAFQRLEPTERLPIAIVKGGSTNNFYRVCVKLDYTGPVRFRIHRVAYSELDDIDLNDDLISIDNILVSYPKSTANLQPHGRFDPEKGGKRVIGQEGAFSKPFLAVNEGDVYGGATNVTYVSPAAKVDASSLVLLSRMYYRWRYANQASNDWRSVDLSPFDGFKSTTPLKLPYDEGDLEFWYESYLNIPFYQYYDYSGAGIGLGGLYTEETPTVTNRLDKSVYSRFTGPGDDWFVRFRAGKSDWDEINVLCTGAYSANVPMELIGDHTWRGLVKVPSNTTGIVNFRFIGNYRRSEWGYLEESDVWWYPTANVEKMPSRGEATAVKTDFGYEADFASNYIEFQFNDETHAFTIGHAEYQTFNAWHDAHREDGKFVGNFAETSGVNVAEMIQTNANMKGWTPLKTADDNWNESFELSDYTDPGFPKYTDSYLLSHRMPHQWNGENGIFVDAALTKSNKDARVKDSGLAWQMRGKSLGTVSFTEQNAPPGLDTVSFKARLAQTVGFHDFSTWDGLNEKTTPTIWKGISSTMADNYTFVVPAILSLENGNDCSPGATMSVVGYYRERRGCYEFRIVRETSEGFMFYIYKWAVEEGGDEVVPECLASKWFSKAVFIKNTKTKPNMYAMFISVGQETDNGTTIIAGLSETEAAPNSSFSSTTSTAYKYNAICVIDNSKTRFTKGSFGVLSSNCNGYFMSPRCYKAYLQKSSISWKAPVNPVSPMYQGYAESVAVTFPSELYRLDCADMIDPDNETWGYTPGRAEYTSIDYGNANMQYGIRAPANLNQTVGVYLKPAEGGAWTLYDSVNVSKYGFNDKPFEVSIKTNADLHVMLKAGSKLTDVTVWQIAQTSWSGENIPNMTGLARDFVYTQARVFDEVTGTGNNKVTNRYCCLQPARVKPEKALSIRSPLLKGLGMIGFSYKDVQPGAEVWVEIATNNVSARLSGTGGYNESILSMDPGPQEPTGTWVTLRKFTYDELRATDSQTHYIGLHDRIDVPLEGAIRLFVPTNVCIAAAANAKKDPNYGAITITDVYVHDEPAIDSKSWMGWNLRTVGDAADSEKRMYLPDLTVATAGGELGGGLSAGLNNSMTKDIVGDPSLYDKMNPTIQSPTFGQYRTATSSGQAKIGQVRFRARCYDPDKSAKVTLYGQSDGAEMNWGEPLTNFTITSSRYKIFEYKAPSRQNFAAIRLVVDGVIEQRFGVQRVLLDEVVVSEKNDTSVGFSYLRPFRLGLETDIVISDILAKEQQPLADESWGVQTQLKFDKFGNDVDYDRGFRVTMRYFVGETPWGYDNWVKEPNASDEVELVQVGAKSDYIFRSTASDRDTVVAPLVSGTTVQYSVTVYYYEKGNDMEYERTINVSEVEGDGWTNPSWYWPVDKNRLATGDLKPATSPYTILDSISPGRAWINEVNYNDGTPAENGRVKVVTNQFIEVAIPSGVDLSGWKVNLTDNQKRTATLAILGRNGVPGKKQTSDGRRSGDYEFLVLESPDTRNAGGIRDSVTGQKAADGTWTFETLSGTLSAGTLQYDNPYEFQLVRPSGIVEHQFVTGGTNEYALPSPYYELFGYEYDGTNLLNELNVLLPSANRFYAGDDKSRLAAEPDVFSSFGVVGRAHGEEGGWSSEMRFTPGRVNDGQDPLVGWYIRPSGGSCWVYVKIDPKSPHLSQQIGEDTARDTFVIVNSGGATSIVYTAANWYQLDRVYRIENEVTNEIPIGKSGSYEFMVTSITGLTTIVACESIDQSLIDAGLDPLDPYTPAVMRWLEGGMANGQAFKNPMGPIRSATYRGLNTEDASGDCEIGLKGMYWFDIDPTEGGWWLRGGIVEPAQPVHRTWYTPSTSSGYTNVTLGVKLYLSNEVSTVNYAPPRLQGLANEKSDELSSYTSWTGVTFKVEGYLPNGKAGNAGFLPFRWFVFGPTSFGEKGSADEYVSRIEIVDPFQPPSIGVTYGWPLYAGQFVPFWRWNITEALQPVSVERLEADSTYEGKRPFVPVTP